MEMREDAFRSKISQEAWWNPEHMSRILAFLWDARQEDEDAKTDVLGQER